MKNALASAKTAAKALVHKLKSAGSGVKNVISDIATDMPAYMATLSQMRIGPTITLPGMSEYQKEQTIGEMYESNPKQAFQKELFYNPSALHNPITKTGSAIPSPRYIAPQDEELNQLRQNVLSSSGFRPAMQKFLSSLPVSRAPLQESGIWGQAFGNIDNEYRPQITIPPQAQGTWEKPLYRENRQIVMDPNAINSPYAGEVLLHEYVHEAPRNMSLKNAFILLANRINPKTQPILWDVSMQYLRNGNPPPNSEEVYATLGQQLGPRALLVPEIRDFYKNVFSQYRGKTVFSPFSDPNLWKNGDLVE